MSAIDYDFPIDPALLNEGPSQPSRRQPSRRSLREDVPDLTEDEGGSESEDEEDVEDGVEDDSSVTEDDDESFYVGAEAEEEDQAVDPASQGVRQQDQVFSRLAGNVSKSGQKGEINLRDLDIDEEIAKADNELLGKPLTRRQARVINKKQHKPSYEVQILVGRANMAYTNGDTEQTIKLYAEVIRHDPYVIGAWNTLASVYEEEGNEEGARQMRFFAAHVDDEGDTWKSLARQFRQCGKIDQCIYCLRKAITREPSDVGVLFELSSIYRLTKDTKKMVDAFKRILRMQGPWAHDFSFLQQFHRSMVQSPNHRKIIAGAFRTAFDWHITKCVPLDPASTMTLQHVITLVDDLIDLEQFEEAVNIIRRGQRWFQGRKDQTRWDAQDTDREFDPPDAVREEDEEETEEYDTSYELETPLRHRLAVLRLRLGDDEEAIIHINDLLRLDTLQYHTIFEELGRMLVKRGQWERALQCLSRINECEQLDDSPDLVYQAAICLHSLQRWDEARAALDFVVQNDPNNKAARYLQIKVYEEMGHKDKALELVQQFVHETAGAEGPVKVPAPRTTKEKKMTKAEQVGERKLTRAVLEDQIRDQMQALWLAAQEAEAEIGQGSPSALDDFIQAAGTMVENFRLAKNNFTKSRGVTKVVREEYKFRRHKKNDIAAQAQALQDRLERALGVEENDRDLETSHEGKFILKRMTEFYGLGREEWLQLVVKYCAVLMVKHEADTAMEILEHVVQAALFNTRRCEVAIRMTTIACAMRLKQYEKIVFNCKRLAQLHQFRIEPFLLMMNCLSLAGNKGSKAFGELQLQKFIHRELVIHDSLVKGHQATYSERNSRWNPVVKVGVSRRLGDEAFYNDGRDEHGERDEEDEGRDEDREPSPDVDEGEEMGYEGSETEIGMMGEEAWQVDVPRPTDRIPHYNVIYGLNMLSSKAYQSALFYLFRAYEQVPYDPLINLAIAQSFFGRAMNRQSDNRNYQIVQGMGFLTKYRKYSAKDKKSQEEVEYNYGRSFHGLGVPHLAISHYERVLKSVEERMYDAGEEFAQDVASDSLVYEAAHNLTQLYIASGNFAMVKQISGWFAI